MLNLSVSKSSVSESSVSRSSVSECKVSECSVTECSVSECRVSESGMAECSVSESGGSWSRMSRVWYVIVLCVYNKYVSVNPVFRIQVLKTIVSETSV